jgi:hypothetical protein
VLPCFLFFPPHARPLAHILSTTPTRESALFLLGVIAQGNQAHADQPVFPCVPFLVRSLTDPVVRALADVGIQSYVSAPRALAYKQLSRRPI